jgi:hypothetical protein
MPFSRVAELKIREAMAEGVFDNLPNAGQPLDLEDYFATPEDLRMAHSILKSAKCSPAEVELLKEIASLERQAAAAADGPARAALQRTLADRRTELSVLLERAKLTARRPR